MVTINRNTDTMKMSHAEIESYAKRFLKDNYNLKLTIPITINSRLSSTLAALVLMGKSNPKLIRIEFSKKYLIHGELDDIISTIKYESIHYALFTLGKPYKDGTTLFESELVKHGSNSTETSDLSYERNVRVYRCNCNEHIFLRTITSKYCTRCNADLRYVGRRKQLV